jgi:hypothetical protein
MIDGFTILDMLADDRAALSGPPDKGRRRRTRAAVQQLDRQIYEILAADHPQSVRHVFYRLTDPRLLEPVEKSERGYEHVQHRLKQLRLAGTIAYSWITDSTRRGYFVPTYNGAADFIRRVKAFYRADLWAQADSYVEVWAESRSIAGVIQAECQTLAVSLYPSGGFTSMTLAYEAGTYIKDVIDDTGKVPVILYVGDFDPAGVLIDRDIKAKLESHIGIEVDFRRLAINEDQIAAYDLPTKPRKETERRAQHIKGTVEAEAMPAHILRDLLRHEVEALLPAGALAAAKVAEESEAKLLDWLADEAGDPA